MPHGPDLRYYPFTYMHHTGDHGGWSLGTVKDEHGRVAVDDDGNEKWTLLPVLKPFMHRPGVAGVRTGARGTGRADIAVAMVKHREQGWVFLDWDTFPGGYVVEWEGVRGPVFLDVFTEPREVRRSKPVTLCEYNTPGCPAQVEESITWDQWRLSLVTEGHIPGPSSFAVERLIRLQGNRAERLIRDAHIPQVARQMESEFRRLETLENFSRHLEDTLIAARKGKRAKALE